MIKLNNKMLYHFISKIYQKVHIKFIKLFLTHKKSEQSENPADDEIGREWLS